MGMPEHSLINERYSRCSITVCILVAAASVVPFFLHSSPILRLNDNLDGTNLVLLHVLRNYGALFSLDADIPVLHGLSRLFFPSELKIWGGLAYFSDSFIHAYLANYLLKTAIGYTSMLLFLKTVIAKEQGNTGLSRMVAVCFAVLPCQPENAIPFASLPLIFYLFHILYNKERGRAGVLVCIFFYPLLSDFSRFGLYIMLVLGLWWLYGLARHRKINGFPFLGLLFLSLGYVATEYRLFYAFLFWNGKTVRNEFQLGHYSYFNLRYILSETFDLLVNGQYHFADTAHKYIVLPLALAYTAMTNISGRHVDRCANFLMLGFFVIIICKLAYMYFVVGYLADYSELFRIVQLDRIYIFIPLILYSVFYLALDVLRKIGALRLSVFIPAAQALVILIHPSLYNDMIRHILYNKYIQSEYTCDEYFSEKLFTQIKEKIHYTGEWSVAVGFYPSVLMYNSIHTLDGYHGYYPLNYKHEFEKIIDPELQIDQADREYFNYLGCRAYIFNKETEEPGKEKILKPIVLHMDTDAFANLGGKYVFSQAKIGNSADLRLAFVGEFEDSSSPYAIYVYEVSSSTSDSS